MSVPNFCPERPGRDTEHCWHPTGKVLLSNPPQDEKQCCFCGTTVAFRRPWRDDLIGHGPHLPGVFNLQRGTYVEGIGTVPPVPAVKTEAVAATYTRSADPEYQCYMQARGDLARLAGRLAKDGYLQAAHAIRDGLEVMPLDLPGLPRRRETGPEVSGEEDDSEAGS